MTTTDTEIFDVMHLSDSFFPTGLFATSNGIERMFFDGMVTTPDQLLGFIKTILEQQVRPSDSVILSNAYDFAKSSNHSQIENLDRLCCFMRPIKETRDAAIRSGNQLAKCVKEFKDDKLLDWFVDSIKKSNVTGIYPVSFAVCCSALGVSKKQALSMFLYGFVVSNVGAALRLGMIQHYDGQKIIHKLKPLLSEITTNTMTCSISDVWQFAPQIDVFQMNHEKMSSKMFIT